MLGEDSFAVDNHCAGLVSKLDEPGFVGVVDPLAGAQRAAVRSPLACRSPRCTLALVNSMGVRVQAFARRPDACC